MTEDDKALMRRLKILDDLSRRQPSKPQDNIKNWLETRCPKCQKKVFYVPKKDFKGLLRCPHCGYEWKQSLLKDFKDK